MIKTQVVVIGSGPGGYTAAFRAADLGKKKKKILVVFVLTSAVFLPRHSYTQQKLSMKPLMRNILV